MSVKFTAGFLTQTQADALNRLFAKPGLGDVWATPPLQMVRGPGGQPGIALPPPESWWAKLTDEDAGAWTHEEWWEITPGVWEKKPLGESGTLDAYPTEGTDGVIDRIVRMWKSRSVPDVFEFNGSDGALDPEVWARIVTPLPTADPGPYTAVGVELVAGVWQDKSPQVDYDEVIYRAPSNIAPPKIPAGQRVRLIPSPTDPDKWEIAAVGGMQTVEFYADNGWGCYAPEKVELTGRDLSVVVTPGGDSVKTITFGPVVTDVDFDAETCELSVTYMNVELNLCTLEGTFVEP